MARPALARQPRRAVGAAWHFNFSRSVVGVHWRSVVPQHLVFFSTQNGDYTLEGYPIQSTSHDFLFKVPTPNILASTMSSGPSPVELRHYRAPSSGC